LIVTLLSTFTALSQQYTIKFATVAPEGTSWMEVMKEYDAAVRKESGGRLGFRIYPGGVQGDEKDVLRKIRLGQLHSAGITGVGIGEIAPRLRVLDAPFLFASYEEVDHIHEVFEEEFARAFEEGGYVLLGWAEVGFVYVFSNVPVRKREDLKNVKMWTWEGDPVAEATFKALEVNPIPLSINDVLTSLQTRLIDGIYAPPMAAIGLQWWSRVKYLLQYPLANSSGAVVIQKKYFDALPDDLKEILLRNGKSFMRKLTLRSRNDNAKAIETLTQRGITVVHVDSMSIEQEYKQIGTKARRLMIGRLFSEEFLNRIEKELTDFRNSKTTR
jgi:TRAP-type C4-dicarboxylate transport system substrate-binding protein